MLRVIIFFPSISLFSDEGVTPRSGCPIGLLGEKMVLSFRGGRYHAERGKLTARKRGVVVSLAGVVTGCYQALAVLLGKTVTVTGRGCDSGVGRPVCSHFC